MLDCSRAYIVIISDAGMMQAISRWGARNISPNVGEICVRHTDRGGSLWRSSWFVVCNFPSAIPFAAEVHRDTMPTFASAGIESDVSEGFWTRHSWSQLQKLSMLLGKLKQIRDLIANLGRSSERGRRYIACQQVWHDTSAWQKNGKPFHKFCPLSAGPWQQKQSRFL